MKSSTGPAATPLKNPRHEQFSQLVALKGLPHAEAYRISYRTTVENAQRNAYRLRGNEGVQDRIQQLQRACADEALLSVRERRQYLAAVVRTPIGAITEESPLAQSVVHREGGSEIKMPSKLAALELDARLAGELDVKASSEPHVRLRLVAAACGGEGARLAAELDVI